MSFTDIFTDFKPFPQRRTRTSPIPSRNSFPRDVRLRDSSASKVMNVLGSIGSPVEFQFAPIADQVSWVEYITLFVKHDGTFAQDVFGSLIIPLANGLLLHGQTDGVVVPSFTNLVDNQDVMQCFGAVVGMTGAGATAGVFNSGDWMCGQYFLGSPMVLKGNKSDFVSFRVRDDLSDLDSVQASIRFRTAL